LSRVGIVTALAREARALAPGRAGAADIGGIRIYRLGEALIAVSGMGWEAALAGTRALRAAGATALASVGTAGALDPALGCAAIVLPEEVISLEGAPVRADPRWRQALERALPRERICAGRLLSTPLPLGTRLDKAIAWRETHSVAVDMESAAVGRAAADAGLPFIAVRVIVDIAGEDLPAAVLAASGAAHPSLGKLLAGLALAPLDVGALMRLARRFRAACAVLASIGEPGLPPWRALSGADWEAS
jgi:adenosylhomocysteine nucleosidase